MPNYYERLNVSRQVSKDDLLQAYLSKACKFHPQHANESLEDFIGISEAFAVLFDTRLRLGYEKAMKDGKTANFRAPLNEQNARELFDDLVTQFAVHFALTGAKQDEVEQLLRKSDCPPQLIPELAFKALEVATKELRVKKIGQVLRTITFFMASMTIAILIHIRITQYQINPLLYVPVLGMLVAFTIGYHMMGSPSPEFIWDPTPGRWGFGMKELNAPRRNFFRRK